MNDDDLIYSSPSPVPYESAVSVDYSDLLLGIHERQDLNISLDFMLLFSVWVCVGVILIGIFRGR